MERKRENSRKPGRRFWGLLGVLWLMIACLAGCGVSAEEPGQRGTIQVTGETEDRNGRESAEETGDGRGRDESGEDGENGPDDETEVHGRREEEDSSDSGDWKETDREAGNGGTETLQAGEESGDGLTGDGRETETAGIEEAGHYTSKDEVALYLHVYGRLPDNYITKREAEELGWNSREGNLWEAAPGMSIGGSRFGNYEGALPDKEGRKYFECDIDFEGGYRGAKRLIYSNDGLIFYTEDHYNTFEQLYGE